MKFLHQAVSNLLVDFGVELGIDGISGDERRHLTMDKALTSDDQVRVVFSLIGDEGTNDKSAPKAGTYSAKADKFMKVESAGLVARKGGADVKSWLDRSMLSGEVKVSSASADEISGDVDLTSGDTSIKGSFTAKVLKRK